MNPSHSSAYHDFTEQEIHSINAKLTEWYNINRRKLPWRGDPPPYGKNAHAKIKEPARKKRKLSKQTQISSYFKSKSQTNENTKCDSDSKEYEVTESMLAINPYHIWISEVMLQQTKVETVIDYYIRWMHSFPTLTALSKATLDEVNACWAGLGYYKRAKFLHEASKEIIERFGGKIPETIKELKSIKGIGDYTGLRDFLLCH